MLEAALAAAAAADVWADTLCDGFELHPKADHVIAVDGEDLLRYKKISVMFIIIKLKI